MGITSRKRGLVAAVVAVAATLAACSSSGSDQASGSNSATGDSGATTEAAAPVAVVTATNVLSDIVAQIGGEQVAATALVTDPAADPHSFEPNAQAQLAVSKAELVVENGGGYDDYLTTMIEAANVQAPVINAVEVSGKQEAASLATESESAGATAGSRAGGAGREDGEFNEHVWYDLPSAGKVAARIAEELTVIRPEQAAFFQANLQAFADKVAGLTTRLAAIKAAHDGTNVAITEPVPLYLTEAAGLVNLTPQEFSEAIEQGTDVPPTAMADTLALLRGQQVVVLVYNEQTSSPETEQVLTAATDNSIAVVGVTETLPEGKDYLSWMDANITALAGALGG